MKPVRQWSLLTDALITAGAVFGAMGLAGLLLCWFVLNCFAPAHP